MMTREEFFKRFKPRGFEVNPLDVLLANAQYEMIRRLRKGLSRRLDSVEEFIDMARMPETQLSGVSIQCVKVKGVEDCYELAAYVEDKERENVAWVWLTMGTVAELAAKVESPDFLLTVKRWVTWLDYARETYPIGEGGLFYHSEWQKKPIELKWLMTDPDVYGFCSRMSQELLVKLQNYTFKPDSEDMLFSKNMDINCSYPGAARDESLFESMSMKLSFYDYGRIELVGTMWFTRSEHPARIVMHAFDSVEHCRIWLSRKEDTTEDCCWQIANLSRQGK